MNKEKKLLHQRDTLFFVTGFAVANKTRPIFGRNLVVAGLFSLPAYERANNIRRLRLFLQFDQLIVFIPIETLIVLKFKIVRFMKTWVGGS